MSAQKVLEFFKAMNQIPRGSGNEKAVSDWLVAFAKARNLEVNRTVPITYLFAKRLRRVMKTAPASFCKVIWIWFVKKVTLQPMIS